MKRDKKIIYTLAGIFILVFMLLIGYLVYLTVIERDKLSIHPRNHRLDKLESEVVRGNIYDSNLTVLATNDKKGNRYYPYNEMYAHVVGYSEMGKTGVEALGNSELLYPNYSLFSIAKMALFNQKFEGRDLVLTLDHRYQEGIYKAMRGKKGGAIVIEASTGKIKAMYSNPSFDPNKIKQDLNALNQDEGESPLVNRATQGLYPPGSIFKIITTLAYMQQNKPLDFTYHCTGKVTGKDYSIQCYNGRAHGEVDLNKAFAKSCNGYFVELSKTLPQNALQKAAESVGFNKPLIANFGCATSSFSLNKKDTAFEKAATAIGQGRTLTTPIHMAMLAASICNDGVSMKPYVIDYASKKNGQVKEHNLPQMIGPLMTQEEAHKLQSLMELVLDTGTAVSLPEKGLIVGGKTGTAQNETDEDHSWFMGYAKDPTDETKPGIAFAIVIEGGGKGAQSLAVANEILEVYRQID